MKNDDLEHLKGLWQTAASEQKSLNRDDLLPLIRQRAQSALSRIRRNMLFEVLFGIAAMIAWGYWVGRITPGNDEAYLAALQMTLLTVLPLFFFYYAGFRHLARGVASDARLVSSLQQTIAHWDQILLLYFWGGAALIPSFLLSSVWFVNCLGDERLLKITDHMNWLRIVGWVLGLSVITIGFVWIAIKISYTKYVEQLRSCLRELEEAE